MCIFVGVVLVSDVIGFVVGDGGVCLVVLLLLLSLRLLLFFIPAFRFRRL